MQKKKWARLLAYVSGLVNQQLLLQNEYLAAENRILRSHLPARLRLSDPERSTLAEMGKRIGRRGLEQVAGVAQPDTILAWLAPGPGQAGVSIQGAPHTTVFAPYGAAMGFANTRHVLGRGNASRQVVVSRLGRVRVLP